jgi:uncharacterized damage-inducible protein DinB
MPIVDAILPEFDREMGLTRRLLERVPDRQFAWKPHAKSMTLGRLSEHLAELPHWVGVALDQNEFELTPRSPDHRPPATREAVLSLFDTNVAAARTSLAGRGDGEMMAPWSLTQGGKVLFTMPKVVVLRNFVLNHTIHHRGQLSVYLRLNDVPLPSIYGPSADEAM